MFTLSAVPVKFIGLLVLFTFTTAFELVRTVKASATTGRISAGLHLLMSLAMLLMVPRSWWKPFTSVVPLPVTIAVMALGVVWFTWLAVRAHAGHRMHAVGCALMFAAMVWHLGAMHVMHSMMNHATGNHADMSSHDHAATSPTAGSMNHSGMDHSGMNHGGMDHGSMASASATPMPQMDHAAANHDVMWWLAIVGLPLMAWLLYATVRALRTAIHPSGVGETDRRGARLTALADVAMNFGMFWMSTGLLVPVLPFFKLLAF